MKKRIPAILATVIALLVLIVTVASAAGGSPWFVDKIHTSTNPGNWVTVGDPITLSLRFQETCQGLNSQVKAIAYGPEGASPDMVATLDCDWPGGTHRPRPVAHCEVSVQFVPTVQGPYWVNWYDLEGHLLVELRTDQAAASQFSALPPKK